MFDWREYLALAHDLGTGAAGASVTVQISEATSRCAVSRAYYAAYCHARVYATRRLGFIPSRGPRDHGRLRAHYFAQQMTDISDALDLLRRWRNMCDYDDLVPNMPGIVQSALLEAATVIDQL